MAANIIVEANNVWRYFKTHEAELEKGMKLIAENRSYGIEIFLTASNGLAIITVNADDDEVYEDEGFGNFDCGRVANEIYDTYLTSNALNALTDRILDKPREEELSAAEEADMMDERELELDEAVYSLMEAFVPNLHDVADDVDEVYEDIKDLICEQLYTKHGISVYRPMYLEDDDGSESFSEFPYPEMELDDED